MVSSSVTTLEMPRRADPASIVRAHQAGLWRYLRYLGCSAHEAEDLTQEVLLAVLRRPFEDHGEKATAAFHGHLKDAQRDDYPLTTCAVAGSDLGSMGEPFEMLVGDRLVRLCCQGCEGAVNADPEAILAKIDAAE